MSIVRRSNERITENKVAFGGPGEIEITRILNDVDEMSGKGRLYNHVVLHPGVEIGWHTHHGDGETYLILKGTGEYSDNGTMVTLQAGDLAVVYDGEGHSLKNTGTEDLEMIALILYA